MKTVSTKLSLGTTFTTISPLGKYLIYLINNAAVTIASITTRTLRKRETIRTYSVAGLFYLTAGSITHLEHPYGVL